MYVDQRALRVDRVVLLERGAPHSLNLLESGKILPDVKVTIVHPDTKIPCAHTDLGEVRQYCSSWTFCRYFHLKTMIKALNKAQPILLERYYLIFDILNNAIFGILNNAI